ncbi:MAG: porin family protein [Chlamydiales bacterium]|nr:porin family protein [Chlamydiia bacterium]MCP5507166.1 porin family protein [Chlamydiales bacterium]
MKKIVLACTAALSLLASSFAFADNCCYDPCCETNPFGGFYLGGNVGVISHTAHRNDLDGFLTDNSGWSTIGTGVTGGVQIGYDWLCDCRLIGVVADWNATGGKSIIRDNPNVTDNDNFARSELDWYSTIRARAGIVCCDSLLYITGGAAVAHIEGTWRDNLVEFSHKDSRWGWVGGFGAEFDLWCNLTAGAEFLFLSFDNDNRTFSDEGTLYTFGHSDSAWVGRIVVNYHFDDLCNCFCR